MSSEKRLPVHSCSGARRSGTVQFTAQYPSSAGERFKKLCNHSEHSAVHAGGRDAFHHGAGHGEGGGREQQGKHMAVRQPLRRDLAGRRAAGMGKAGRMGAERRGKGCRVHQALREEQQREAGARGLGFPSQLAGKGVHVGLVRGERRKAASVARAQADQPFLPQSRRCVVAGIVAAAPALGNGRAPPRMTESAIYCAGGR